jgi:hypothetical protein
MLEIVLSDFLYNEYGYHKNDLKIFFKDKNLLKGNEEILNLINQTEEFVNKIQII